MIATIWPQTFSVSAIGCDPSLGTAKGDYAANVFAGTSGGVIYVDAEVSRRPPETFVADIVQQFKRLKPLGVIVESNMFQQLLGPMLLDECKRQRLPPMPFYMRPNTVKKSARIMSLGPYLQQGLIRIRKNEGGRILVNQCMEFPLADHDDAPDALEMAIRLMRELAA